MNTESREKLEEKVEVACHRTAAIFTVTSLIIQMILSQSIKLINLHQTLYYLHVFICKELQTIFAKGISVDQ